MNTSDLSVAMRGEVPISPKLLIIDDELVHRIIISKIAKQVGYEAFTAASFDEAINLIQKNAYNCITLDLSLGEHSGTRLLRSIAESGRPPVIIISGREKRVLDTSVRLANMLGIACVQLPKPLNIESLRSTLSTKLVNHSRVETSTASPQTIEATELLSALKDGEIIPFFQPKIELKTGKVVGCEALARWKHSTRGVIGPDVFVPVAEAAGLMPEFTEYLLRAATRATVGLVQENPGFSVAINMSASLFSDLSLPDQIDRALCENAFPPKALSIEITESAVMSDIVKATEILVGLRVKDIGLAIDDFGIGYSSLVALARMPFSEMKLDKQFVGEFDKNPDIARVVRACVRLGHELDMKIVAEGIETVGIWNRLSEIDCDIGQGHLFAPALDATQLTGWIASWYQRSDMPRILPSESRQMHAL